MKKFFINMFIYIWIICMVMFAIACPIAAIGCAIAGKYAYAILFVVIGSAGIGGYLFVATRERTTLINI